MAKFVTVPPAEYVEAGEQAERLAREIWQTEIVAIDTETTGLDIVRCVPLFWSLSWHSEERGPRRVFMKADTMRFFEDSFKDPYKKWVFHNAKFDAHMLANVGYKPHGVWYDTAVMHAMYYEEEFHKLKEAHKKIFGWTWQTFEEVMGVKLRGADVGKLLRDCWERDPRSLIEYASYDAYGTLNLYEFMRGKLEGFRTYSVKPDEYATLWDLYEKTEVPFTQVLWKLERRGILIDKGYMSSLDGPIEQEIKQLEKDMVRLRGKIFNPNSNAHKLEWLVKERGLQPLRRTKGGKSGVRNWSVDKEFMEANEGDEAVFMLRRHADLTKLLGTYIRGLQPYIDDNGRLHTQFNQGIAVTGRLTSSNPNAQNIPNPEKDKFKIRRAFVAPKGMKLIVGDYEQIEMRLLAAGAGEQDMIDIFLRKWDIHMGNAVLVFSSMFKRKHNIDLTYELLKEAKKIDGEVKDKKRPAEDLTETLAICLHARSASKTVGFGLNYGMQPPAMALRIGCTVEEAEELYKEYMNRYPAVRRFFEQAVRNARTYGYAFTALGRARFLPEILSPKKYVSRRAERQAGNFEIQGTAAEVIKLAMINIDRADLETKYGARMLLQVHDELVFECPEETAEAARDEIQHIMEHALEVGVPLEAKLGIGDSWESAK